MSSEHTHEHGPECDHGAAPNPLAIAGVLALVTVVIALLLRRRRR